MSRLSTLKRYVTYLVKGKTRYWIHSPFLFSLVNEVLRDQRQFYAFSEIETLKKELENDNNIIEVEDFGAGSKNISGNQRSISQIAKNTAIPPKYGKLLFRLANHFGAENILELGTGLGISTLYLGMANPKSNLITLEGSTTIADKAQGNFDKLGLSNATLITGPFKETLPIALGQLPQIDLAYIDGGHSKKAVLNNFEQCLPKLHNHSIMVFDDINWSDGMYEAWQQISHHPRVTLSVSLFRCGLLFFRQEMASEHIRLYY